MQYLEVQLKLNIGKQLGFWASNASSLPKIGTVFNCYLLNKHPPIRLHAKTLQFWGEFGRNSQKVFENTNCFQISRAWFLGYFSQSLSKIEQFFHAVL